jgi:hypothetical protein
VKYHSLANRAIEFKQAMLLFRLTPTMDDRILSILLLVVGFSFGGWMLITDGSSSIGWCPLITMFKFVLLVI